MDWFTIVAIVLFFGYGVLDAVIKSRLRSDIEELQVAMYGFNFQLMRLEEFQDNLTAKEFAKTATPARKTTAKEAK